MNDSMEIKCPSCRATITFDAGTQSFRCPYCDSVFSIEDLVGREDSSVDVNDMSEHEEAGQEWAVTDGYMSEYHCESCGGDIYTDENTSATMCPYCGSSIVLKGRLSGSLKPDMVIPFKKTKEQALADLKGFCSGKRLLPKNFFEESRLEATKGLYVPYWIYDFDIEADIDFTGIDRSYSKVNDVEYVTEHFYDVNRAGAIAFDDIPVDGSKKMPDDLMESIEPFDSKDLVEFQTPYLSGFIADKYDVDSETSKQRAIVRAKNQTVSSFRSTARYDEVVVNNAKLDIDSMNCNYVLYPVWLFNTVWNDRKFTFAMNGQTGKMAGDLPADRNKTIGYGVGIFAISMIVFVIGISCLTGDIMDGLMFGTVISFIITAVIIASMRSNLKTVSYSSGAYDYIRDGSMNVTKKKDIFLYQTTHRR